MRCPDMVMSAMSYHPRHRKGPVARAYWAFTARWQDERGGLHVLGGQWYLLELASRFRFRSVRSILLKSLPLAVRRQKGDGGFSKDHPASSACVVVLAYSRHGMLKRLLSELRYDPRPLIQSLEAPFRVKTCREALGQSGGHLARLSKRLSAAIIRLQDEDGSWNGLVTATAAAIHDLLDCGVSAKNASVVKGCRWILAQQGSPVSNLFSRLPPVELAGMLSTTRIRREAASEMARHPEYRWESADRDCFSLVPIYQTGAALAALSRCGLYDDPRVKRGFEDLLKIRGPGGRYYTDHWCGCNTRRWLKKQVVKFGEKP